MTLSAVFKKFSDFLDMCTAPFGIYKRKLFTTAPAPVGEEMPKTICMRTVLSLRCADRDDCGEFIDADCICDPDERPLDDLYDVEIDEREADVDGVIYKDDYEPEPEPLQIPAGSRLITQAEYVEAFYKKVPGHVVAQFYERRITALALKQLTAEICKTDPCAIAHIGVLLRLPIREYTETEMMRFRDSATALKQIIAQFCEFGGEATDKAKEHWQMLRATLPVITPESAKDTDQSELCEAVKKLTQTVRSVGDVHTEWFREHDNSLAQIANTIDGVGTAIVQKTDFDANGIEVEIADLTKAIRAAASEKQAGKKRRTAE